MNESEESSIEKLKRALYSRDENLVPKEKRASVHGEEIKVATSWGEPTNFGLSPEDLMRRENIAKRNPFFSRFLLVSLVFFAVAASIATFVFLGGVNMVSSNNVDIKIVAPSSTASGEELDIGLSIINQNRADLEDAVLTVDYPEGTRSVGPNGQAGEPLIRDKIDIGTIARGASRNQTIRTVLFGEKGATKSLVFTLEYGLHGSNATFSKQKTYEVSIGTSPLLLSVAYPKEINSGQTVPFTITVTSNSPVPLKNVLIKTEYPYGFTYVDSDKKPLDQGNSVWNMGDLKNGDKKTLTIKGTLVGQDFEERSFIFSVGSASADSPQNFETGLAMTDATVAIRKSFFALSVASQPPETILLGQSTSVNLRWQNTLPDKLNNNRVEVRLSGNIFDPTRVTVGDGGFYRSSDTTILWDKNSTPGLSGLSPGQSGQTSFSVWAFTNNNQLWSIKNPHIDIRVSMTGDRTGPDGAAITSTADITLKMPTTVTLLAKSYRAGPIANTGPIPPVAEKETTYTITLVLINTVNDVKNAVMTATIPAGVEWKDQVTPVSERLSYNPDNRTVTWDAGNVSAATGFSSSPRIVSFQVALTPSLNQIGSSLVLVSSASGSGTDTYTGKQVSFSSPAVTTRFSDSDYRDGQDKVVR